MMILIKKPEIGGGIGIMRRLRHKAEEFGVQFTDLTLEMEVAQAKTAMSNLDMCGFLTHKTYASFVATVMSITDYEDREAGHKWLHTWLETSDTGGSCDAAFNACREFGNMLCNIDSLPDTLAHMRYIISEKTDIEEMTRSVGTRISEVMEGVYKEAGQEQKLSLATSLQQLLQQFKAIFTDYATAENGLHAVVQTAETLAQVAPFAGLGLYITNGMLAVNWGVADPMLINTMRTHPLLADKLRFEMMEADKFEALKKQHEGGHGGDGNDGEDFLAAMKELFGDEDD